MLLLALNLLLAARPAVAVMPVTAGDGIPASTSASFTDALAAELRKQVGVGVVTSRDVAGTLSFERQKQALGCATDGCMAEIAGAMGADRLVVGEVSKLGESLLLHLRLLDARSAQVLTTADRRFKRGSFDDLLDALPAMVRELLAAPPRAAAKEAPPPARPPARAPAPPPAQPSPAATKDTFVLHYHRRDGNYGFRLTVWESFEEPHELRSKSPANASSSALAQIEPSGTDDFGPYWALPTAQFRNGRVNFVLGRSVDRSWGRGNDECTYWTNAPRSAQFWLLSDGPEVWAIAPDCDLFPSLEAAQAALQKDR